MARERRGIFSARSGGIITTSLMLLVLTLLSRLLSMVREMLLAQRIGMNALTDAFNISQSAITFCTGCIGATCLALVPLLVETAAEKGNRRRDEVFSSIFCVYMAVALLCAVVLTAFAEPLMGLLAPGFDVETQSLAASLLRIGFIKINCVVAGSLFSYYLQSRSVFIASSLSALSGSALIVVLLVLNTKSTIYDYTVYSVFGFIVQAIVPLFLLLKVRYRPRLRTLFERKVFMSLLMAAAPLMLSTMFMEVQTLVGRAVASGLGEGAVSSLDYANKLIQLLYASVVLSLNSVLFTKVALAVNEGDRQGVSCLVVVGGKDQLLFLIPFVLLLLFFGVPLVALLFQRGSFTADDTAAVSTVLVGYLGGAWAYVFSDLLAKYFVSVKQYMRVNASNAVGYGVALVIVYPLSRLLGAVGISLAFAIAQNIIMCCLLIQYVKQARVIGEPLGIRRLCSLRDFAPAATFCIGLVLYVGLLGLPSAYEVVPVCAAFLIAYALLLKVFKVKVRFNGKAL